MVDLANVTNYVSLAFLVIVGFGLGATTKGEDFQQAFRNPKAVGIGLLSQYLFMPVAAYLLSLAFQIDVRYAVGVVLIGCSPGGTTSNLFTYWSHGDVALSITMSFLSTTAAFAFMPLWLFVLVKKALKSDVTIAWFNMILALLLILFPTCLGLLLRKYNTKLKIGGKYVWELVEIFATIMGIIFIIAAVVLSFLTYGELFVSGPASIWIMAVLLQPIGCLFGYFAAKLSGMNGKLQRTISLETGVQNFALTVAIVNLSFEGDDLEYALLFPVLYGLLYFLWSPAIVLFFRCYLAPKQDGETAKYDTNVTERNGTPAGEESKNEGLNETA
mmetsp:Transcript_30729/g.46575  ORF Transcript_30729/g.46575 Transcript_30729/m.46575 type:complete len:330 (+) Transcript_30729:114-1103(+)|eukprot:CAMPEP_0178918704 /NCGR_PEP_ID=MMETSP0786-20121207/13971_1 /TAXON_ID=186022 /ORGANISM="Thalassionema frauenfeldii, Strain CCMP 1798" /LENGTH=329 /DNA_ID=CAMNT_0020592437 /DNA_START=19 /DNA_END=1008 /DNA_ORIENTATION=+